MSSVIRPSGPLPQRVYWVRRLLFLAVAVVVITLLWWSVGRLSGTADEGGGASDAATGEPSPDGSDVPDNAGGGADGGHQGSQRGGQDRRSNDQQQTRRHRLAQPTGNCLPAEVGIEVVAGDSRSGAANLLRLKLTSLTTPACTLAITPSTMALRITSGDDVIWSSDDCPDELEAEQVVLRKRPATSYQFEWDGYRSTESCAGPGMVAPAGGYWAEAALIGAESHQSYFDIT